MKLGIESGPTDVDKHLSRLGLLLVAGFGHAMQQLLVVCCLVLSDTGQHEVSCCKEYCGCKDCSTSFHSWAAGLSVPPHTSTLLHPMTHLPQRLPVV